MTRTIDVVPYDPCWAEHYQAEREALRRVFGQEAFAFDHIGSTSIPGIKAKPVIDILVTVRDIGRMDAYQDTMIALGYQAKGEFGIPGRRFFIKGGEEHRSHHVHIFERGHPEIARHLNFCAYLRANPVEAARYSALKEALAYKFRHDPESYTEGKSEMIREIDREALIWSGTNRPPEAGG